MHFVGKHIICSLKGGTIEQNLASFLLNIFNTKITADMNSSMVKFHCS